MISGLLSQRIALTHAAALLLLPQQKNDIGEIERDLLEQMNAMASSVRMVVTPILERKFIDDVYELPDDCKEELRKFISADRYCIEYAGTLADDMHSLQEVERILY